MVVDLTLTVGALRESVVVQSEVPAVQISTSDISAVVNATTVRELPLNGRSWTDLAQLLVSDGSAGIHVEGDRTRLQQVIVNLIDNAIKYTQVGGRIEVSVGKEGNTAVLEVSDNGPGIPPECLPHVFERFYRADKARSRASGGAGLGLSIVKSICAAHSAEVKISSREGRGSCFRVELPLLPVLAGDGANVALRHSKSERAIL